MDGFDLPSRDLRRARELFISQGEPETGPPVRLEVKASWRRSRELHVDASSPEPAFVDSFDNESGLLRAARPVLAALEDDLAGEPVCIILTDANGLVLDRRGGNGDLHRLLSSVYLEPGFTYSESNMGTNGIGTALESGSPSLIDGPEHYAENLGVFACAGAPIKHPITGAVLGLIDLTSPVGTSNSLLIAFAKLTARRIQQVLLESANTSEVALLNDYYRACKHTGGPVIALGGDVLMMNDIAQQRFTGTDQVAILSHVRESLGNRSETTFVADLPSGTMARMTYRPTFDADRCAGGVFRIQELGSSQTTTPTRRRSESLRGVVGRNATWQRTVAELCECARSSEWVALSGEPGVGKLAVVDAVNAHVAPGRALTVVEAGESAGDGFLEAAESALQAGGAVLLRYLDRLSPDVVTELSSMLQEVVDRYESGRQWVTITIGHQAPRDDVASELLPFFPRTVTVPPLRHRIEDLPELVDRLLAAAGRPDLTLDAAAKRQLMRLPWSGNVERLRQVLADVARHRRSGTVGVDQLPPECRSTTRRSLTQIEALERDAIVKALTDHGGDKTSAANALGMSRATIYRRIHDYGIVS